MTERIPAWVQGYIGIPFLEKGRDRDGLDCWGLHMLLQREQFGHEFPDYQCYETVKAKADRAAIAEAYRRGRKADGWDVVLERERGKPLVFGAERIGDGVLMRIGGDPLHCGMVIGEGMMLHIDRGIDSCVQSYTGMAWSRRVLGIFRPRDR
jgi:cell wall-associated NlpC family hydrolase